MPAPKGSQNALGNKGGGRPSTYQEQANAEFLYGLFFEEYDVKEIEKKVASGKYSASVAFLAKALTQGKNDVLIELFKKLFPDRIINEIVTNKPVKITIEKQYGQPSKCPHCGKDLGLPRGNKNAPELSAGRSGVGEKLHNGAVPVVRKTV